jgi:predicted lipoprotein with Yx(FWY)xxD motif
MTEDLEERVEELERRVRKLEQQDTEGNLQERGGKPVALAEFKQNFEPNTYTDKVTVVSRYLEKHEGMEGFTVEDLKDGFRKCKWKRPANMSDVVSKAAGKGLFMEIGEQDGKKKWMLTENGEEHAEDLR